MNYQAEHTAALLDRAYAFQSVSGKNASFGNSIKEQSFFFRTCTESFRESMAIHAGGQITYTVPLKYEQAPLPYAILFFICTGEGSFSFQGNDIPLVPNTLLLFPADTPLLFTTSHTPFSCYAFYLSGSVLTDYLPQLCGEDGFLKKGLGETSDIPWRLLPNISEQLSSEDENSALYLSTIFHLILSSLLADKKKRESVSGLPEHLIKMKQIFDSDYRSPHSLKELESILGVNRYRLCRDFSTHIGISPVQYLNQVRLTRAKDLLLSTNLTIHEVGSMVGIDNTTHFINLFKKNTGITPLQFRQTYIP